MSLKLYLRNGVWNYRGTIAKRRLRGSTGIPEKHKDLAAREVAKIEVREWKCHIDGPEAVLTFAQAAIMYRAAGKSERFLAPVEDYFKDTLVKDIKAGTIKKMAMTLYPNCSGASKNRMAIIPAQAVINFAAESELCPRIRVKRFEVDSKVKEPADLQWVKAFMAEASPHLGALALFMFLTGCRPGEALAIDRQRDLDLQAKTAIIRETKVRSERKAHLPVPLVAALANVPAVPGRPLFIYRNTDDMRAAWDSVIKRAGIQRLTPHCCRHGFATELLRNGVDVVTVAWLGGWESPEHVLKTYGHALKKRDLTDVLIGTPVTQAIDDVAVNARKRGSI
jgi:integrase